MRYTTMIGVRTSSPERVWQDLHRYKVEGDATLFFPVRLVRTEFKVLSPSSTGVGATYFWRFSLLGLTLLSFTEQVTEWQENQAVTYKAVGMTMRVVLTPRSDQTSVQTELDYSLGSAILDRLVYPFVSWGVPYVFRQMKRRVEGTTAPAQVGT